MCRHDEANSKSIKLNLNKTFFLSFIALKKYFFYVNEGLMGEGGREGERFSHESKPCTQIDSIKNLI